MLRFAYKCERKKHLDFNTSLSVITYVYRLAQSIDLDSQRVNFHHLMTVTVIKHITEDFCN